MKQLLYNIFQPKIFTVAVSMGVGVGMVLGWFIRGRICRYLPAVPKNTAETGTKQATFMASNSGAYKLVLVVRTDLKMGKGKAAAQCAHAAVHAAETSARQNQSMFLKWKREGQPKVVVKVDSEEELLKLEALAKSLQLNTSLIRDAGRTQIAPGSVTVLGVGPGPENLVDSVTGSLKLY